MVVSPTLSHRVTALLVVLLTTACLNVWASQTSKGGSSRQKVRAIEQEIVDQLIVDGQLTQRKVDERGGADQVVDIESIDLNRDGKPEYVVSCACENMEANFIFRRTADGLKIIYWGTQRENIKVLRSYTRGWRNIRSTVYRSVDGFTLSTIRRWSGEEYK